MICQIVSIRQIFFAKRWYRYGKWSVIACDQFTSQADYWDAVEKHVADAPSTLNVVFPEIYLGTIENQDNDCKSSGDGVKNDKETGRKTNMLQ